MPFRRPVLQELDDRIRNDVAGRMRTGNMAKTASLFRRSVVSVLSRVYSGVCHGLYGFLDYLATQRFVHSMDEEFLDAEGMTYDMPRKSADYAVGSAEITGSDGATVAVGAICKIANYAEYAVTKASPIMDGLGTVTLKALIAGQAGNVPAGTELRFVETIPGVNSIVTVGEDGLRGGVDAENNEDYRERILDRKREPPHGGNKHDYEVWAKEVPGVTRVWCLPLWLGLGTVGVMFVRDYDADIFPTKEQCQKVWSHIEEVRPVTASEICVFAPVKQEINIVTKLSPDNDATRQAVIKELTDFIIREGKPSEVPEEGTYIHGSRLSEAIADGEEVEMFVPSSGVVINASVQIQAVSSFGGRANPVTADTAIVVQTEWEFTESTQWQVPVKANYRVTVGGGGGGSVYKLSGMTVYFGGGAGGGCATGIFPLDVQNIPIVVGPGGTGVINGTQTQGNSGGSSSFGNMISATGGLGGLIAIGSFSTGGMGIGGNKNLSGGTGNVAGSRDTSTGGQTGPVAGSMSASGGGGAGSEENGGNASVSSGGPGGIGGDVGGGDGGKMGDSQSNKVSPGKPGSLGGAGGGGAATGFPGYGYGGRGSVHVSLVLED